MRCVFVTNNFVLSPSKHKMFSPLSRLVDKVEFLGPIKDRQINLLDSFFWKINLEIDHHKINRRLLELISEKVPDFIFIVKGTYIYPSTLKSIKNKNIKMISWSLDDMYAMHNRTFFYDHGLKYFDLVVTTKSYNVHELKLLGAKNILFQYQAFEQDCHKPCTDCSGFLWDVCFVGSFEKERFESIKFLAQNGIKINLWGQTWAFLANKYENITFMGGELYDEEYAKIFACSKISLNFLRKKNRDLHTSRSIEIPACKGFMIAERTDEHKLLFTENEEAVYFSDDQELLEKILYYLIHIDDRNKIADAGYLRCVKSDYSYDNRIKEIIDRLNN